jgi:hydroxyethylthiazole kinase-like uncharacterized protein yjeF
MMASIFFIRGASLSRPWEVGRRRAGRNPGRAGRRRGRGRLVRIARNPGRVRSNWADGERMAELLTAAQMRAIEQAAIESGQVTGLELMERAGRGVVEAILEEWPGLATTSHRAVVLCGPGNNGGDGFVVARLLRDRGWEVEVFLYGDPDRLPPDAMVNYERWVREDPVGTADDLASRLRYPAFDADIPDMRLFVDAAFGTGLKRALPEVMRRIAFSLNDREEPERGKGWIVGIDVPSGLCADSGRVLGDDPDNVCFCDLTVTFCAARRGHFLAAGPEVCGSVRLAGIGLEVCDEGDVTHLVQPSPRMEKGCDHHKYRHGHTLILSGDVGKGGAARLAARGALRIGAGLVTVGCPPAALQENAARLDAIMLRSIYNSQTEGLRRARPAPQGGRDTAPPLGPGATLAGLLEDTRINALCLGPGLGQDRARALAPAALAAKRATVLDADALTAFADDPAELFSMLHDRCVLTPHGGEFARLFPDIAERLAEPATAGPAYSKVDATRDAAARAGCTVLFKGPDTVIASPGGRVAINSAHYDRAAPWLATAGSGDVLAGFIAGLLARGLHPMQAAETAAWLHVECARAFGPGLIAEDLPEMLPEVFRELGA